jgi:hypothetical protein
VNFDMGEANDNEDHPSKVGKSSGRNAKEIPQSCQLVAGVSMSILIVRPRSDSAQHFIKQHYLGRH